MTEEIIDRERRHSINDEEVASLYWRLFKVRFLLYSLIQLGLAWKVSTGNLPLKNFHLLQLWDWVSIGIDMLVIWGGTMLALFDQSISRLARGKLPMNGGNDTSHLVKPTSK